MEINSRMLTALILATIITGCNSKSNNSKINYKPFDAPSISKKLQQSYLKAINEIRAVGRECGRHGYYRPAKPLKWNNDLYLSAYEHSWDMLKSNTLSHRGSGTSSDWSARILRLSAGSTPEDRGENNGYGRGVGENIYVAKGGYLELKDAIESWLQSDDHCRNLMSRDYQALGMERIDGGSDSRWDVYWTQNFGI